MLVDLQCSYDGDQVIGELMMVPLRTGLRRARRHLQAEDFRACLKDRR